MYLEICAASNANVEFGYRTSGSSDAYSSLGGTYDSGTGMWTSDPLAMGSPSYELSFMWFGCSDVATCGCSTTTQYAALSEDLTCNEPTPAPTPRLRRPVQTEADRRRRRLTTSSCTVCDGDFAPGDTVVGISGARVGLTGTVICAHSSLSTTYLLVEWDSWTYGHNGNGACACGETVSGSSSSWYVQCSDVELDAVAPTPVPTPAPTWWSQPDSTDLQLWLRADELGCAAGETVASWSDLSSNGYVAAQANASHAPACAGARASLNGHAAVRFGGEGRWTSLTLGADPIYASGSGLTVFAVVANVRDDSQYPWLFDQGSWGSSGVGMYVRAAGAYGASPFVYAYSPLDANGTSSSGNPATLGNATAHVVTLRFAFNAEQTAWLDGEEIFSKSIANLNAIDAGALNWAAAQSNNQGPFTIGAQSKGYTALERYASLELAELLVYDAALSDTQVHAVEQYLDQRYALADWTGPTPAPTPQATFAECAAYTEISDSARHVDSYYGTVGQTCDSGYSGWYRFTGAAGTRMPETSPGYYQCGTAAVGWLSSSHPAEGVSTTATVCFHWTSSECQWSTSISVTNCGAYYVYELSAPPTCNLAYCGESSESTESPTLAPTVSVLPSPAPSPAPSTPAPSPAPTRVPTPTPSQTCSDDEGSLYSVRLFDAGGDGWQGATWAVYLDQAQTILLLGGTLAAGASARVFQCIPNACAWLVVGGGAADSEISWEFDSYAGDSFTGVAPVTDRFCVVNGVIMGVPSAQPSVSSMPTQMPSAAPTAVPAPAPTAAPTRAGARPRGDRPPFRDAPAKLRNSRARSSRFR